jgi:ribonuclease G
VIDEILFNDGIGETRAALLGGGVAREIWIENEDRTGAVGTVVLGRVQRVVPGLGAAFVDLGHGESGFLAARDAAALARTKGFDDARSVPIDRAVHEGEAVLVQITTEGHGDKGPRVSTEISLAGRTVALTPTEPGIRVSRRITDEAERARLTEAAERAGAVGAVVRTVAAGVEAARVVAELRSLGETWDGIAAKMRTAAAPVTLYEDPGLLARLIRDHLTDAVTHFEVDTTDSLQRARRLARTLCPELEDRIALSSKGARLFEERGIEAEIAAALEPRVALKGGGWLSIEPTEGLIAIDVNAGGGADTGFRRSPAMEVNLAAAGEIARQVRLRGLSGLMVVDFIHVGASEDAMRLVRALEACFADDPVHTRVSPMSEHGLVEITRRRARESLAAMLETACPTCGGHGHVPHVDALARGALRRAERDALSHRGPELALSISDAVAARLTAGGEGASLLSRLEARIGKRVRLERAG